MSQRLEMPQKNDLQAIKNWEELSNPSEGKHVGVLQMVKKQGRADQTSTWNQQRENAKCFAPSITLHSFYYGKLQSNATLT